MSLDEHIRIVFNDIKIHEKIHYFDLWKKIYKKINPHLDLNFNNLSNYKRIYKNFFLSKYFIYTNELNGDVIECGVLGGFSAYLLRNIESELERKFKNNFYLIDSFEGLSEISKEDLIKDNSLYQHKQGELKVDIKEVEKNFNIFDNVNLVKGWVPKIFTILNDDNKYRFVHLDMDLYKPTIDALNYIYDKVIKGGIIITDDYVSPLFPGNKIAWDEFIKSNKIDEWIQLPSGQAVLIK